MGVTPRVIIFLFFALGGKTATDAKLRGHFVVFFLGGQNRNFVNVRGLKLQLSLKIICKVDYQTCCLQYKTVHFKPYNYLLKKTAFLNNACKNVSYRTITNWTCDDACLENVKCLWCLKTG